MNIKIDVHQNGRYENKLNSLGEWNVPDSVKIEVKDFIKQARLGQVQLGKRLSDRTLSKYLSLLKHSLEIISKSTSKINKKDIEKFDKELTNENLASSADFRRNLKIFLKWKLGEDKAREIAGWLDTRTKNKTPDYLTEREVESLYRNCKSASERFLISILFDAGTRAEEFLNIRFEDIQLPDKNQEYVKLTLKEEYSKTNGRVISLFWKHSLESVNEFLKERKLDGIKLDEPIYNNTYDGMRMFLHRLGMKVLKKEINPHLFRHSSATFYATKLNRQELCYRYGWRFSSDMVDVYISRSGMESKELDEKFKSTELKELQKELDLVKLNKDIEIESLKQSDKENSEKIRALFEILKKHPKEMVDIIKKDKEKIKEIFSN